jgi:hypothetical protein
MGVETAVPKGGLLRGAPLLPLHSTPNPPKVNPLPKTGGPRKVGYG